MPRNVIMTHSIPSRWGNRHPTSLEEPNSYGTVLQNGRRVLIRLSPDGGDSIIPELSPCDATAKELANQGKIDCPVANCGPYATTVHNSIVTDRRDHFRHPQGKQCSGQTNPESNEHAYAKTLLLHWATSHLGKRLAASDLDTRNITITDDTGTTSLRPDAWLKLTNGTEVAIEYQRSPADPQRVLEKTRFYHRNDITVWWVFSHRKATCRVTEHGTPDTPDTDSSLHYHVRAEFTPAQTALAQAGIMFFWFDPTNATLATPATCAAVPFYLFPDATGKERRRTETEHRYFRGPGPALHQLGFLYESPLEDCSIDVDTGALLSPAHQLVLRDAPKFRDEITSTRTKAIKQQARDRAETKAAAAHTRESFAAELERHRQQRESAETLRRRIEQDELMSQVTKLLNQTAPADTQKRD